MRDFLKIFILILITVFPSFAGVKEGGNGGDIILCENKEHESHLTLLDFYEGMRLGLTPRDYSSFDDEYDIAREIISSINHLAPARAEKYRKWLIEFDSKIEFVDKPLIDIQDSGLVELPDECYLKQLAIQTPELSLSGHVLFMNYQIRKKYWSKMDQIQKAYLIVHEIILREAKYELKLRDSIATRALTALMASEEIMDMNMIQYNIFLNEKEFYAFEYRGHNFEVLFEYKTKTGEVVYSFFKRSSLTRSEKNSAQGYLNQYFELDFQNSVVTNWYPNFKEDGTLDGYFFHEYKFRVDDKQFGFGEKISHGKSQTTLYFFSLNSEKPYGLNYLKVDENSGPKQLYVHQGTKTFLYHKESLVQEFKGSFIRSEMTEEKSKKALIDLLPDGVPYSFSTSFKTKTYDAYGLEFLSLFGLKKQERLNIRSIHYSSKNGFCIDYKEARKRSYQKEMPNKTACL